MLKGWLGLVRTQSARANHCHAIPVAVPLEGMLMTGLSGGVGVGGTNPPSARCQSGFADRRLGGKEVMLLGASTLFGVAGATDGVR